MIRSAELIRVDRMTEVGRNRPLRVAVVTADHVEHEAVLKPAGWNELTRKSVVKETIASILAGLLDVPVCEPFLVNCSPNMIDSVTNTTIKSGLQGCQWPAFASKNAGSQWSAWATSHTIDPSHVKPALAILAFDAFTDNPDRCRKNPNLLTKAFDLRAIDHEMGFAFCDMLPFLRPPPPWETNSLDWLCEGDQANVILPALKCLLFRDLQPIKENWKNLTDAELDGIFSLLPFQNGDIIDFSQNAINRIKQVRDNIDACIEELERVLS